MAGLKTKLFRRDQAAKLIEPVRYDQTKSGERDPSLDAEVEGYVLFLRQNTARGKHLPRVSSFVLADYVARR